MWAIRKDTGSKVPSPTTSGLSQAGSRPVKAIFILLVGESKSLRDGRRAMLDLDADREVIGLSIE